MLISAFVEKLKTVGINLTQDQIVQTEHILDTGHSVGWTVLREGERFGITFSAPQANPQVTAFSYQKSREIVI